MNDILRKPAVRSCELNYTAQVSVLNSIIPLLYKNWSLFFQLGSRKLEHSDCYRKHLVPSFLIYDQVDFSSVYFCLCLADGKANHE
jgi:hypothetical protein